MPGLGASLPYFQGDPQHVAERGGGLRRGQVGGPPSAPLIYFRAPPTKKNRGVTQSRVEVLFFLRGGVYLK